MAKIKPFQSPFNYLAGKIPFLSTLGKFYYRHNKFDKPDNSAGVDPRNTGILPYLLGGFNPLIDMKKDFVDTFKPYKNGSYYVQRDLLQPLRGIGNTLRGIFNIVISPILLTLNTLRYAVIAIKEKSLSLFLKNMALNISKTSGGFLNGVFSVVRGLGQLVTTPATWLLRMPLRGILSWAKGRTTLVDSFKEQAVKLENLVKKDNKTVEDTIAIDRKLGAMPFKIAKALRRGQDLGASQDTLVESMNECRKFTAKRLNAQCVLNARFGGNVDASSYDHYADADQHTCNTALRFLSIFTKNQAPEANPSGLPH